MKHIKDSLLYLLIVVMVFLSSCEEDNNNYPLFQDGINPGIVTNISVENLPGSAKISYTLPDDQDLAYVEAHYVLPSTGEAKTIKSSAYNNNLTVVGFGNTDEQEVTLYAVDKGENKSDAVSVTIKPLENPIWDVFRSLNVSNNFGGFDIAAENESLSDIAVEVMEKDEYGEWQVNDEKSIYTSTKDVENNVRGLDTLQYDYAIRVRDRFMNYTDTLFTSVNPWYEILLPKKDYSGILVAGDAPHHPSTSLDKLWDGEILNWPSCYLTNSTYPGLHSFSFDIGTLTKVSRVRIWDYPEYYNGRSYYYMECMKKLEIWGRAETPDLQDSSFDGWILLGTFEQVKPSGLPYGEQNDEDYNTANAGFNWMCDVNAPKVRYIRIRCLENWMGTNYLGVSELQVYGDPR